MITRSVQFKTLHVSLYTDPINTTELLDAIIWGKDPTMKLVIEFINLDLPKDIRVSDILYNVGKMIRHNNGDTPIASFSLVFNPLIDEFENIDRCILYPFD